MKAWQALQRIPGHVDYHSLFSLTPREPPAHQMVLQCNTKHVCRATGLTVIVRDMIYRIAIVLLLSSASLPLLASEESVASLDNGGDCDSVLAPEAPGDSSHIAGTSGDVEAASHGKASSGNRGGNAENSVRTPRTHSLLPGMFR